MWKVLYRNTIVELGIGSGSSFSGMDLSTFWKRAFHINQLKSNFRPDGDRVEAKPPGEDFSGELSPDCSVAAVLVMIF